MLELIHKRHEGPGWQLFTELWDGTGARARGRADAVAMGIWPSRGYEIHGYEIKETRGDLRQELRDVDKADAVGRYCDFWWLVVRDVVITDGLLLPKTWGILTPHNRVLRVVKKASKRKPVPVTREFAASMLRSVTKHWVPKRQHQRLLEESEARIQAAIARDRLHSGDPIKRALAELTNEVAEFEKASGVDLANKWDLGEIGAAVRVIVDATSGHYGGHVHQADTLDRMAKDYTRLASEAKANAQSIRDTVTALRAPPPYPLCGAIFGQDEPYECDRPLNHEDGHSRGMGGT